MKTSTQAFNIETFSRKAWRAMEAGETFYGYENRIGFGFTIRDKQIRKKEYFISFLYFGELKLHGDSYPEMMESLDAFIIQIDSIR